MSPLDDGGESSHDFGDVANVFRSGHFVGAKRMPGAVVRPFIRSAASPRALTKSLRQLEGVILPRALATGCSHAFIFSVIGTKPLPSRLAYGGGNADVAREKLNVAPFEPFQFGIPQPPKESNGQIGQIWRASAALSGPRLFHRENAGSFWLDGLRLNAAYDISTRPLLVLSKGPQRVEDGAVVIPGLRPH